MCPLEGLLSVLGVREGLDAAGRSLRPILLARLCTGPARSLRQVLNPGPPPDPRQKNQEIHVRQEAGSPGWEGAGPADLSDPPPLQA